MSVTSQWCHWTARTLVWPTWECFAHNCFLWREMAVRVPGMKVVDRSSFFGKCWKLRAECKRNSKPQKLKSSLTSGGFAEVLDGNQETLCAARRLNSGSKSTFAFLTKKCERLQCWFLGRAISDDCDGWTVFRFYPFIFLLLYFFGGCTCLQWHLRSCALFLFVPCSYKNVELADFWI